MSQLGSLLVVDDEPEIADVVRDFFEGLGYSVNCALNGRDALVLASLYSGLSGRAIAMECARIALMMKSVRDAPWSSVAEG